METDAKGDVRNQIDRLTNSVKLESEKLRVANGARIRSKAQEDSRNRKTKEK